MTLAEFIIATRLRVVRQPSGCMLVCAVHPDLYRLTDYVVSTVSCGQTYLIPKQSKES